MKKCLIISGGDFDKNWSISGEYSYVIACDHGMDYAIEYGITPDIAIGDFDSIVGFPDKAVKIERYPKEKDDTDTMLAVKRAIELGIRDLEIICAFGGRLDHTIANLQCAKYAASKNASVLISGVDSFGYIIKNGEINIRKEEGYSFSVFAMSDICNGVSIKGAKYTVDDIQLANDFPLGISNEFVDDVVVVSVSDGIVMVLCSAL